MDDFINSKTVADLTVKLWRGERMVLIAMDVDNPTADFVGFAIEEQAPGSNGFVPLRNRLNFSYDRKAGTDVVDGYNSYPSTEAPFQKFRWVQFPADPKVGEYTYRVTMMHMNADSSLTTGTAVTLDIFLNETIYNGFLDIGFTRNYASSQAYADKYGNDTKIIPATADQGLDFKKVPGDVYQWLGFEAYELIFGFLNDVAADETMELDFFAYDFNEPDILTLLEKIGPRLRAIIDDSGDHKPDTSAESQAAERLAASAGADRVKRMHFKGLQHNKVLIAKRDGAAVKVLFGSTNFSFRGLYIQANNVLVFRNPEAAGLFEQVFEIAFSDPKSFAADPISQQWHLLASSDQFPVHFCFSPHADNALSLGPVSAAIDQATSSVFFSIAFLSQMKGTVREAIDRLMQRDIFSYGISERRGNLEVRKPNGSVGLVSFAYLAKNAPEPFKSEWAAGTGPSQIHQHDKFVVTDFGLPTSKVFTGSSNLSPSGETKNGDNLVMIEDPKVATAYAIEALRIFDHLHFSSRMENATDNTTLTLQKPTALNGGHPAWFEEFFVADSQTANDRKLFSH